MSTLKTTVVAKKAPSSPAKLSHSSPTVPGNNGCLKAISTVEGGNNVAGGAIISSSIPSNSLLSPVPAAGTTSRPLHVPQPPSPLLQQATKTANIFMGRRNSGASALDATEKAAEKTPFPPSPSLDSYSSSIGEVIGVVGSSGEPACCLLNTPIQTAVGGDGGESDTNTVNSISLTSATPSPATTILTSLLNRQMDTSKPSDGSANNVSATASGRTAMSATLATGGGGGVTCHSNTSSTNLAVATASTVGNTSINSDDLNDSSRRNSAGSEERNDDASCANNVAGDADDKHAVVRAVIEKLLAPSAANKKKNSLSNSNLSCADINNANAQLSTLPSSRSSLLKSFTDRHNPSRLILLREQDMAKVLGLVREVFMSQPMLLEVTAPMKVCGDIHGQYYDLLRIFDKCGYPGDDSSYLFLGDYVDRGTHSIETIMLLFCYKILFPQNMWLLRGNHECAAVTRLYGFYDDVKRRYNVRLWKQFTDVFNTMPCCGVISEKIICMHGGLSPDLTNVRRVNQIQRPIDVPDVGLLCDLLWSDPAEDVEGFVPSGSQGRGVSYIFGEDIVETFLDMVNMDLIVRGHEVQERGYGFFANRQLVTVFSAPNYCGEFENEGAVMTVADDLVCSFTVLQGRRL